MVARRRQGFATPFCKKLQTALDAANGQEGSRAVFPGAEEAREFAASGIESTLGGFISAVRQQWAAIRINRSCQDLLHGAFSQTRVMLQVADDFAAKQPEVVPMLA